MKSQITTVLTAILVCLCLSSYAQQRDIDNFRKPDQRGIYEFEAPKDSVSTFDGVKVRIGGASTIQFQALDHENSGAVELIEIGNNFNLATANLDLDVVLHKGLRMHLRTYLSSRHHPEPYVKGGYFQIDALDFIQEGFLEEFMKYTTIKIGHMEQNYGDAHFRRSDNAQALHNPFVGNLIMDGFTTEVGAELYYRRNGFISMIGISNGKLNQAVSNPDGNGASFLAKLGYDNVFSNGTRFRLTGSIYTTGQVPNAYLYSGDRAGSRYYLVLEPTDASSSSNFRSGRYNPNFRNSITALMFNPYVKFGGLELFGTLEFVSGRANSETDRRNATQFAGEAIYRFGNNEDFYVGGRYNVVNNEEASGDDIDINRFQLAAGWFMTKNVLMKVEYVTQKYDGFNSSSIFDDGKFNGLMAEAVIAF
ncbi:hypothetical protein [Robertkochia solimangrovi]|uniref:hypothetical protein n=1 Tax=Robertkochia solimangrovi TaxID=2213046 RepID=UPI00117FB9B4|nr:hypothetical protein [Robertkochia solimangrovi]TRZ46185.1 hypothetical protein DMZ48_02695 [Robertkochia solimangrovi]